MTTQSMRSEINLLPILAFCALGLIWGCNFIYIKMAANLITPMQIVLYRVVLGFICVAAYAIFKGYIRISHLKYSIHFAVMSLLAASVYYLAYVKGIVLLMSGVAGALSGSVPLFSFILAVIFIPEEKITLTKIIGVLTGFAGVVLIAMPSGSTILESNIKGVLYIAFGSLCLGASFVYAKKFVMPLKLPTAALTAYQLGFSSLTMLLFTDYKGIGAVFNDLHTALGLFIGLGLLGTSLAYIIYYYLVKEVGTVTASSVTYIPPVVALFIGAVIVGEPITITDYIATIMIFMGIFLLRKNK
ncbi:EamA domain-containing membrane protein RarD [Seleniivibrio woodruffii]|uniref:EamA domain-containing membrane protein RarD n=2 Tax=Seleniivibrio woodruffii TaxID=1078050 RepID=A0A4R1K9H5_9BACT|nr:DMT family transporter [Seleniivibrio woodruffii]TCK61005.1 EamA domain-containing membrane protein RarD [Seleniivibrio woodruffii]TVZ36635.1 EamA domain-containing membrane protein RarD [Seleniivibrio woodruffii]